MNKGRLEAFTDANIDTELFSDLNLTCSGPATIAK